MLQHANGPVLFQALPPFSPASGSYPLMRQHRSAVAFAIGLLVNVFGLWPVERKKRAEEAKEKIVSEGDGTLAPG